MCEAFQELFKDEIMEREKKGKLEGKLETLIDLVKDNLLTLSEAAKRAGMTEALFEENMKHFSS